MSNPHNLSPAQQRGAIDLNLGGGHPPEATVASSDTPRDEHSTYQSDLAGLVHNDLEVERAELVAQLPPDVFRHRFNPRGWKKFGGDTLSPAAQQAKDNYDEALQQLVILEARDHNASNEHLAHIAVLAESELVADRYNNGEHNNESKGKKTLKQLGAVGIGAVTGIATYNTQAGFVEPLALATFTSAAYVSATHRPNMKQYSAASTLDADSIITQDTSTDGTVNERYAAGGIEFNVGQLMNELGLASENVNNGKINNIKQKLDKWLGNNREGVATRAKRSLMGESTLKKSQYDSISTAGDLLASGTIDVNQIRAELLLELARHEIDDRQKAFYAGERSGKGTVRAIALGGAALTMTLGLHMANSGPDKNADNGPNLNSPTSIPTNETTDDGIEEPMVEPTETEPGTDVNCILDPENPVCN